MGLSQKLGQLRKKAPQLIVIAIAVVVVLYFVIDILDDVVIEGNPATSEPLIGLVVSIVHGVTSTIRAFGYPGIFVLMFLETSSLPIPSEVILPFAGYLSFMGQFNSYLVVAVATVAGIFGSLIDYYIGLKGVQSLVKHKILGKVILSTGQLQLAEKWFDKHGSLVVFASRLIPGFRTTFSFPAGAAKMPLKKFLIYTTAGCLLWNAILVYLGWYLGKNWTVVAGISQYIILGSVAAAVIAVVIYLVVRRRKMQEQKRLPKQSGP
ncbi:MAG: DedA family protein [Candidatus Bathyarchaeia archaeon]